MMTAALRFSCWLPALLGLLAGCTAEPAAQATTAVPKAYAVLTLQPRPTVLQTEYPATLQGQTTVEIRPRVDGFLTELLVDEGARVKRGQLLFRLNNEQATAAVHTASAAIHAAEADVQAAALQVRKTRPMVARDIISPYDLEAAEYTLHARQAALAQATSQLRNAQADLRFTRITSPTDGVIGTLPYRLGSLVSSTSAEPLTTIASQGDVYAYFSLNEKQLLDFRRAARGGTAQQALARQPAIALVLADGTTYPHPGRLQTVSGLLSGSTGTASFRASFPNPEGLLTSGGTGTVRLPQPPQRVLLVPQAATYELQGKHLVYVVGKDGTLQSTEIQVVPTASGQDFVVLGGLSSGAPIVLEGVSTLRDGQRIRPRPVVADSVYASRLPGLTAGQ